MIVIAIRPYPIIQILSVEFNLITYLLNSSGLNIFLIRYSYDLKMDRSTDTGYNQEYIYTYIANTKSIITTIIQK